MNKPVRYCLCQDCLKVYPFTLARHQEEEFCSCGGQLCGCSDCDSKAIFFVEITNKSARVDVYNSLSK
jgi:hypothetical protein